MIDAGQHTRDSLFGETQTETTVGQVLLRRDVPRPQVRQQFDAVLQSARGGVHDEAFEFVSQLPDGLGDRLRLRRELRLSYHQCRKVVGPGRWRVGQRGERKKLRPKRSKGLQSWQRVDEALHLVDTGLRAAALDESLGVGRSRFVTLDYEPRVSGRELVGPVPLFLQGRELFLEVGKDSRSHSRPEEAFRLRSRGAE